MAKRIFLVALLICLVFCTVHAQRARDHIAQGREHLQAQRFEQAIESFEAALRLEPRNRDAPGLLVQAQEGRTTQLFREAERLRQTGNFSEAITLYNRALEINPNRALNQNILIGRDQAQESLYIQQQEIQIAVEQTTRLFNDAERQRQAGNFEEAIALYDRALRTAPAGFNTRDIQNNRNQAQEALQRQREIRRQQEEQTAQLYNEGQRLHREGRFDEALAKFDEALALAPSGYNTRNIQNSKTETERARAAAQSTAAFQTAIELLTAENYAGALVQFLDAVSIGGLNQNQTNEARGAINVLQDFPNKQASYNRPLREDDFRIDQIQSGIEITAFLASETFRIRISGRDHIITAGIQDVVIPNNLYGLPVTVIGENAFREKNLTSVTLPNSLVTIKAGAFSGNRNLTAIVIPNSVTELSSYYIWGYGNYGVFQSCGLTSVTLGSSVRVIGNNAFADNKLTSITLPASVRIIDMGAFANNQITSVSIPNGVEALIGNTWEGANSSVFVGNPLTTLVIPQSLASRRWESGREIGIFSGRFPDTLTRVTLPANVNESNMAAFEDGLRNFYIGQNRAAGTYVKNGPVWTRQ